MLLYAPLGAALMAAQPPACCATDSCPMPGHHHGHAAPMAPAPNMMCNQAPGALAACSLNCCESADKAFVSAHAFVLPGAAEIATTGYTETLADCARPVAPPRFTDPLFPPPRS